MQIRAVSITYFVVMVVLNFIFSGVNTMNSSLIDSVHFILVVPPPARSTYFLDTANRNECSSEWPASSSKYIRRNMAQHCLLSSPLRWSSDGRVDE